MAFCVGKGSAQASTFNWSDTTFKVESRREIKMIVDPYGGPCSIDPCYLNNQKMYDTLIWFLKSQSSLKVQIASYFDSGVDSSTDSFFSKKEAEYIGRVLVSRGIDANRITTIGYANSRPLIKETDIIQLTKKEQDKARDKNTRIEVIITSIETRIEK